MFNRRLILWVLVFLGACSTTPPPPEPAKPVVVAEPRPDLFAVPAGLEPQVEFWRKVYSHWGLGQVVLHDDRHLQLIYGVIELPGAAHDHYGEQQRRYVRIQRQALRERLEALERKAIRQEPLGPAEQRLMALISDSAGRHVVFGAAERLRSQRGLKQRFKRGLEVSGRYLPWFRRVFSEAGLPEDLAFLPHVESSFQAHARSSAGATGMWQFTRGAAKRFMRNHPALDERLDPIASARGAARYLKSAYTRLGYWPLAVTSYNHGILGMTWAKQRYGGDFVRIVREYDGRTFKFASRNFYAEFLAARQIALQPERYFPEGIRYQTPLDWDHVVLERDSPVSALAWRYGVPRPTLVSMNPAWTRAALKERVALPVGTRVWLPNGTLERAAAGLPRLATQP